MPEEHSDSYIYGQNSAHPSYKFTTGSLAWQAARQRETEAMDAIYSSNSPNPETSACFSLFSPLVNVLVALGMVVAIVLVCWYLWEQPIHKDDTASYRVSTSTKGPIIPTYPDWQAHLNEQYHPPKPHNSPKHTHHKPKPQSSI